MSCVRFTSYFYAEVLSLAAVSESPSSGESLPWIARPICKQTSEILLKETRDFNQLRVEHAGC